MIVRMLVIRDVKMLVNAVVNAVYDLQSRFVLSDAVVQSRFVLSDAVVVNNVWCSARRAVSDR